MKIWVDDIRTPPDATWFWAKDSAHAISAMRWLRDNTNFGTFTIMSLDHDLGGDDTTRPVVLWCCENNFWPMSILVHTSNPVGREWLEGMIDRYMP